jgi:hypothetical protein
MLDMICPHGGRLGADMERAKEISRIDLLGEVLVRKSEGWWNFFWCTRSYSFVDEEGSNNRALALGAD